MSHGGRSTFIICQRTTAPPVSSFTSCVRRKWKGTNLLAIRIISGIITMCKLGENQKYANAKIPALLGERRIRLIGHISDSPENFMLLCEAVLRRQISAFHYPGFSGLLLAALLGPR